MGTTGYMKRLRVAALHTWVGMYQQHSWSVTQLEIGGDLMAISIQDGAKYRCSLGLTLWLNSPQVYGLKTQN